MEENNINAAVETVLPEKGCAKDFLTKLIEYMGADCTVEEKARREELCYYIKGSDAHRLIGYRGEGLDALQHLALHVAKNTGCGYDRIVVDADFYRQKREATLGALAKKLARQAAMQGKPVELEPMSASERRMIHSALQGNRFATTHSEGEGRARHIVITPIEGATEMARPERKNREEETRIDYGSTEFTKKGPKKTRSFGYSRKRF